MKSFQNPGDEERIIQRIKTVGPTSQRRWGKMSSHQMICLLRLVGEPQMAGEPASKRGFMKHTPAVARTVTATVLVLLSPISSPFDGSKTIGIPEGTQEREDQPVHRQGISIDGKSYWFYEAMGILENVRETKKGVEGTFLVGGARTDFIVPSDQVADVFARSEGYRMAIEKVIFFMSPTGSIPHNETNRKYVANLKERLRKMTGMNFKGYTEWKEWLDANRDKLHWSKDKNLMIVEGQK
jgi:hypothetical protein